MMTASDADRICLVFRSMVWAIPTIWTGVSGGDDGGASYGNVPNLTKARRTDRTLFMLCFPPRQRTLQTQTFARIITPNAQTHTHAINGTPPRARLHWKPRAASACAHIHTHAHRTALNTHFASEDLDGVDRLLLLKTDINTNAGRRLVASFLIGTPVGAGIC